MIFVIFLILLEYKLYLISCPGLSSTNSIKSLFLFIISKIILTILIFLISLTTRNELKNPIKILMKFRNLNYLQYLTAFLFCNIPFKSIPNFL